MGAAVGTVAYNAATGARLWARIVKVPSVSFVIAASPDGARVYVTGHSPAATGQDQSATVAYDATTGAVAWVARYGHAGQNSAGEGVAVSPDSSAVYVTGDTASYGTTIGYGS